MIPGFIVPYRDKLNNVHLYFYPGYDDSGDRIYRNIVWQSERYRPKMINLEDGSIDYDFMSSNITSISCKLVSYKGGDNIQQKFSI